MDYSDELSAVQASKDEQIESLRSERNSYTRSSNVSDTIPPYSEQEAQALADRLGNEETYREAQQVLSTWLEEGQCNENNSSQFYSLIYLCGNRVKKLQTEEKELLEDAQKAQTTLVKKSCCILLHLDEFEELFKALDKGNIWGNFNQNQIEEIQKWRRDSFDLKENIFKGSFELPVVIEGESSGIKNVNDKDVQTENVAHKLTAHKDCENVIKKLKSELEKSRKLRKKNSSIAVGDNQQENSDVASQCKQKEMHIVSLVSIFLYKNKDGVNIDGIYNHLQQWSESNKHIQMNIPEMGEIENLMRRYPQEFKESSSVGSTKERKWTCISTSHKSLSTFLKQQ